MEIYNSILLIWLNATVYQAAYCEKIHLDDPLPELIMGSTNGGKLRPKNITIMMSINYGGPLLPFKATGPAAMKIALDRVRLLPNTLEDYEIIIQPYDDRCTRATTVKETVARLNEDSVTGRFPLILGPFCSGHLYTGQIAHHYNFVGLTSLTIVPDFQNDRRRYDSFYVSHASPMLHFDTLVDFCYQNGWRKLAVISEIAPYFNTLEREMLLQLENRGMSLLGLFKIPFISGQPADESDIRTAVEDLSKIDPRIIVVNSNTAVAVACWLHRYNLFGTNYVILIQVAFVFSTTDETRYSWCTEKMLRNILESAFFYGDTSKESLYGHSVSDATGFTSGALDDTLRSLIENPESHFHWKVRYRLYDIALLAAFWLNSTETFLRKRNETLSDWTTNTKKFQQNGHEIRNIQKQSLYSIEVAGLQSDYGFQAQSDDNTAGFAPIGIFQFRTVSEGNKTLFTLAPVAVYTPCSNHTVNKFDLQLSNIVWRTYDGSPPVDEYKTIYILIPTFRKSYVITLQAISGVGCVGAVFFFVMQMINLNDANRKKISHSVPSMNNLLLLGDIMVLSNAFLLPTDVTPSMSINCTAIYCLLVLGTSLVMNAMLAKLELASILFVYYNSNRIYRHFRSAQPETVVVYKLTFLVAFCFNAGISSLIFTWILFTSMQTARVTGKLYPKEFGSGSIVYQETWYKCSTESTLTSFSSLIILCIIEGILIIRACFVAKSFWKRKSKVVRDIKLVVTAFYAEVAIILAAGLLGAVFYENFENFQICVSSCATLFVFINLCVVFGPKIFQLGGFFRAVSTS